MLGARAASLVLISIGAACSSSEPEHAIRPDRPDASEESDSGAGGATDDGGEGGRDADPEDAAADVPDADVPSYPALLSEAGLYADIATDTLAEGVRPFAPEFELWSDQSTKRRWVLLPEGAVIDTRDMDHWSYPSGTRLFKEFTRDGIRVETRLLWKAPEGWQAIAYRWNHDGSDAVAVPSGETDARGTDHDIPDRETCDACHGKVPDRVLGFSALQLAHDGAGVTLASLATEGRLSDPPALPVAIPGAAPARAALGYLHANCGSCHNPSTTERIQLLLWLSTDRLDTLEQTPTYATTVGVAPELAPPDVPALIEPGEPEQSALLLRMMTRDLESGMPPVGSERVDDAGVALVRAFIESL